MNTKIEEGIREAVKESLDNALQPIRYNLSNLFGGLLFSLKLEMEKKGYVSSIDELISLVVDTSHYTGPEHSQYPTWVAHSRNPNDLRAKRAKEIIKQLEEILRKHGIEQAWNLNGYKSPSPYEK